MKVKPKIVKLSSPARHSSLRFKIFHAYLIALYLRLAMFFGFVVVIIGVARSGKTLILERTTPNKVICKHKEILSSHVRVVPSISISEIPRGIFSIDETNLYDRTSLTTTIANLSKRAFALSLQSESDLKELGLDKLLSNRHRLILKLQ